MNNSFVLCTMCFVFTRRGLQIHLCFTSEFGEILGYNRFLAGGVYDPRVQLIVWNKVTNGFITQFLDCSFCIVVII